MSFSKFKRATLAAVCVTLLSSCTTQNSSDQERLQQTAQEFQGKPVVYQIFTRLFGNTTTTNKPWGTIEENGVGKLNDISHKALAELKQLGVTHVWYTGIPHHALIGDYTAFGISADDPDVVKGRAGSPYAVKDYYSVNPDLAVNPAKRLEEFDALIERTHQQGLKVIIDIVPNHVARHYQSLGKPEGVRDFGADDRIDVEYARDNNFYYVIGEAFRVPVMSDTEAPLGGEKHPLADRHFAESPAKWTGNGSRAAQPDANDWYETVKINYGVRPDGSYDFPKLPRDFAEKDIAAHKAYWDAQSVPNSWLKFRHIAEFWLDRGVDGFRFDMAEMVPVEFWSYLNSAIKTKNPDAFLLAEIYNPKIYGDYIHLGKMDYLYDKVDLYDRLKDVVQGKVTPSVITEVQENLAAYDKHLLRFLENHDEQRIAHPEFAGDAKKAKPAMTVTALLGQGPVMIYFGQEVGEPALENAGFGKPSRTSIFDYIGVPHHQRWMNNGAFDGGQLSQDERALRTYYQSLLKLTRHSALWWGGFEPVSAVVNAKTGEQAQSLYSFIRTSDKDSALVVVNFSEESITAEIELPSEYLTAGDGAAMETLLSDNAQYIDQRGSENARQKLKVKMNAYSSLVLKL